MERLEPFATFRDPAGTVIVLDEGVFREVRESGNPNLVRFLGSSVVSRFTKEGKIVATRPACRERFAAYFGAHGGKDEFGDGSTFLEHERVPFQSFPREWPPEMLAASALATLDLAEALLEEGSGLKDATPFNVLFRGTTPIFVDVLSVEARNPCDPIWIPHAQFVRTFLLPLLVNRHFQVPLGRLFGCGREGIEAREVYAICGALKRFHRDFLTSVTLPVWLDSRGEIGTSRSRLVGVEECQFILRSLFRGLRRKIQRLERASCRSSSWSEYTGTRTYTLGESEKKRAIITRWLSEIQPAWVLDVGSNTGEFSLIAARDGASVVSIDSDPVVVGELFKVARAASLDILPLVVDFAHPTPATGWKNAECSSFLARSDERFDVVLMLAVLHHLLIAERIPLREILNQAHRITKRRLVLEYVSPADPMFQALTRGRSRLYEDLDQTSFEQACVKRFKIVEKQESKKELRWIYLLEKDGA